MNRPYNLFKHPDKPKFEASGEPFPPFQNKKMAVPRKGSVIFSYSVRLNRTLPPRPYS